MFFCSFFPFYSRFCIDYRLARILSILKLVRKFHVAYRLFHSFLKCLNIHWKQNMMSETSLLTKFLWNLCKMHKKWNWMENYNWRHIHLLFNEIEITKREKEKKKPQTKWETDKNKSVSWMLLILFLVTTEFFCCQ